VFVDAKKKELDESTAAVDDLKVNGEDCSRGH